MKPFLLKLPEYVITLGQGGGFFDDGSRRSALRKPVLLCYLDTFRGDLTLLCKFEVIQELTLETRSVVNTFLDMVIRDFKIKKAYAPQ